MFLKSAAILALSLFIGSLVLVFVVDRLKREQKDPQQLSPHIDAEANNRKTLEDADAMKAKQAERFLLNRH